MSKKIIIANQAKPKLKSGRYTLEVEQSISIDHKHQESFKKTQDLLVQGVQFQLPPTLIYALDPPPSTTLNQSLRGLAHIAFTQETLPWQRSIGKNATEDQPWLALLILHESETEDFEIKIQEPLANLARTDDATYHNFIFNENTNPGKKPTDTCNLLKIKGQLFNKIVALKDELKLLTHTRQVVDEHTGETQNISVVSANRLGQKGMNHAFLVSLEDMGHFLPSTRKKAPLDDAHSIGLICLHHWSFNEDDIAAGYIATAKKLSNPEQ